MVKVVEMGMRWVQQLQFEGGPLPAAGGRPQILVDGDSKVATSPIELLLLSAATCSAADVVIILQKQRVELAALEIAIRGTRREEHPRRYTAIAFHFTVRGTGVDAEKVRRAIALSIEKYCSVVASLAPDIQISYDVTVG